ncbi:metallophosphatase [Siphonobacter sp. BAB-5405]|uniref:metallophosphoesterase n=1 Tax=Siphonobacter sp. BAB-5405 TaxID=1864825 RepID=UPI000C802123|nr:metallophosphoesterase [Siphonobacter sp. BAB-5405]PMD96265.1 metallophosphatase [Siphonobacter sp. BAB-5405]
MNRSLTLIITLAVLLVVDWYGFQAVKAATQQASPGWQRFARLLYWSFPVVALLMFALSATLGSDFWGRFKFVRGFLFSYILIGYLGKIFMVPFLLLDDLSRAFRWVISHFNSSSTVDTPIVANAPDVAVPAPTAQLRDPDTISRSEFLAKSALVASAVPAIAFTYGIVSGAHDYRIRRVPLVLKNLPKQFDGLRIAQISDIHSGSFFNKTAVKGGIEMLLREKPDMVFFTGDLVNDRAIEVKDYKDVFDKVKAPLGVFSTLGNHDYGDYAAWNSPQEKRQNLLDLERVHREMGYDLLLDEHRFLEMGGEKLAIIGIQNWGTGGFAQYGNLKKAAAGTEEAPVKLLLSHDPSHWDAQVRPLFPDIDVQFAGHTHGMQFGVETKYFRWSPVQYRYKQWAGLYEQGDQKLYVNRGYGYIGYPGRVGMPPEITIFELKKG